MKESPRRVFLKNRAPQSFRDCVSASEAAGAALPATQNRAHAPTLGVDESEKEPGDHLCCLYRTEEERRSLLTPFLRAGLEGCEKVLYVLDTSTSSSCNAASTAS